jgi:hypothetical protein
MKRRKQRHVAAGSNALFLDSARLERIGSVRGQSVGRTSKRGATQVSTPLERSAPALLGASLQFLSEGGYSRKQLIAELQACISRVEREVALVDLKDLDFDQFYRISEALHDWFRDPRYVNAQGAPISIPWRGAAPSLEHLIARRFVGKGVADALNQIKLMHFLKESRSGHLLPPSVQSLIIGGHGRLSRERVALRVGQLLATATHNTQASQASDMQFERVAHVRRLAVKHIPRFRAYVRVHGQALLELVDAWLEDHVSQRGEPSVAAGVHLYQYCQPNPAELKTRTRAVRHKSRPSRRIV